MDAPGYDITADREGRFLRIVVTGYWAAETAGRFMDDLKAISSKLAPNHVVLVDLRGAAILPQGAASDLQRMLRTNPKPPRRVAILVAGALVKLQAARLGPTELQQFFDVESDAIAWLEDGGSTP